MANEIVTIGGVTFNKQDVKSQGVVEKDGQQMNCVFLQDGTKVVYPNQEGEGASITQDSGFFSDFTQSTTFTKVSNMEVTGTENKDVYNLEGCKDSVVDVSQDDGKHDKVTVFDAGVNLGIFNSMKDESSISKGNSVKLGKGDYAIMQPALHERGVIPDLAKEYSPKVGKQTVFEEDPDY